MTIPVAQLGPSHVVDLGLLGPREVIGLPKLQYMRDHDTPGRLRKCPEDIDELRVIDLSDQELSTYTTQVPSAGTVIQRLMIRPQTVKVRIVLLSHHSWLRDDVQQVHGELNSNYLTVLESKLDLDSGFLATHFALCDLHQPIPFRKRWPVTLPKARRFLQIQCSSDCHFTVDFTESGSHKTSPSTNHFKEDAANNIAVVVFMFHYHGPNQEPEDFYQTPFLTLLPTLTLEEMRSLENSPHDAFYNTMEEALRHFGSVCFEIAWDKEGYKSSAGTFLKRRQRLRAEHRAHAAAIDSLSSFFDSRGLSRQDLTPRWINIMENYQALIEFSDKVNEELKDHLQSMHSIDAINETRKGLR